MPKLRKKTKGIKFRIVHVQYDATGEHKMVVLVRGERIPKGWHKARNKISGV
jgi:hypothetical protein